MSYTALSASSSGVWTINILLINYWLNIRLRADLDRDVEQKNISIYFPLKTDALLAKQLPNILVVLKPDDSGYNLKLSQQNTANTGWKYTKRWKQIPQIQDGAM